MAYFFAKYLQNASKFVKDIFNFAKSVHAGHNSKKFRALFLRIETNPDSS